MLSGATPSAAVGAPRVDAGDFYWYQDRKIPLQRVTDEVVLGLEPTSAKRASRLIAAITADLGPLRGYSVKQVLTTNNYLLKRSDRLAAPDYRRLLRRAEGFPALKYLAPTFFTTEPGSPARAAVTDEVTVKLVDPSTAPEVFTAANGYAGYSGGTLGSVIATLAEGGGLDALRTCDRLHQRASVEYAEPNFYSEIILA
jgi:hypothetical protein